MLRSTDRLFRRYRKTGEPRLLGRVFDRTAPELLRVALHLTRDRHAAEDALQATFLAAIEKRDQWDAGRPLLPWLLTILANHCRQAFRRERRALPTADAPAASSSADVADAAANAELARACDTALDALAEPYRPVLALHLRHGLAAHEIAVTLARPDSTVRNQIARGLDLLRRKLPAGAAGAVAIASLPDHALAAVRAHVLREAPPAAAFPSTATALGTGAAALGFGGTLMGKHVVVAFGGLAAIGLGWWALLPSPAAAPPAIAGEVPGAAAVATLPESPPGDATAAVRELAADPPANAPATGALVAEIVGADGTPIGAAACSVWRVVRGWRHPVAQTITASDGTATFAGLAPGNCELVFDATDRREGCTIVAGGEQRVRLEVRDAVEAAGIVVDRDGRAVGGAEIRCDGDWFTTVVARSAADGTFQSAWVRQHADLWAVAAGQQPSRRHRLDAGSDTLRFVVGEPGAALHGRVVDERGAPVPSARVYVGFDKRAGSPFRQWERHDLRADAEGSFALDWARPGAVVVVAMPADFDLDRASWRELELAADVPAAVRLELGDAATVAGTVRDERGAPLPDVGVESSAGLGMGPFDRRFAQSDAAGAYVLTGLWPGKQHMSAQRPTGGARLQVKLDVAQRGRHAWDPVLGDGVPLLVRALFTDGAPVARHYLSIARGAHIDDYGGTDAEGRHRWLHLAPGDYTVRVYGADYSVVLAERTLAPGPNEHEIRIDAGKRPSAHVSGRVVDTRGAPVPGADVALYAGGHFRAPQHVDADGRFRSQALPPGVSSLSAAGRGHGLGWVHRHIELTTDQQLDLGDLVLPATASLAVRLRGSSGEPVRGAMLRLDGQAGDMEQDEVDAAYRQRELQPGKHTLQVLGAAFAPQRIELVLAPGEARELDLVAVPAVPIVLEFHFARQRPDDNGLVNAQLELSRAGGERVASLQLFGYFTDWAQRMHRVSLGLPPGKYQLHAQEYGGRTVDTAIEVPDTAPSSPIVIDMR